MGGPQEISVAIVGAGAAGLSAGAALQRRGVEPVVFDGDDRVGGRWARRYERLCLHTVRRFSGLAHHPIPREYPRYVPKDLFARYLSDYARHFGLDLRLGHRVEKVRAVDGNAWAIETNGYAWRSRVAIIATGHYNRPLLPSWPGADGFQGRLLHSVEYRTGRSFAGQRALVIGIGNSGAEIAVDLVGQGAAYVAVSVRTPPPIMPRDVCGVVPVQLLGLLFGRVPAPKLLDRVGALMRRVAVGDLRRYGLEDAAWGPFTARRPPVIDVGFLRELKRRRVHVRPNVGHFTRDGVAFVDGTEEGYDVVVAATGFDTALRDLLELPDAVGEHGLPAFPSGRATPYPGLYFIGYDETIGGHLRRANLESRRLAKEIERYLAGTVTRASRGTSSA